MDHPFLYTLFVQLKAKGLPLGTRDFIEGLEAVPLYQSRFIQLREIIEKKYSQQYDTNIAGLSMQTRLAITWLCQTLWARTPQEKDIVSEVINHDIGLADNDVVFHALKLFQHSSALSSNTYSYVEPAVSYNDDNSEENGDANSHADDKLQQYKTRLTKHRDRDNKKENVKKYAGQINSADQDKVATVGVDSNSSLSSTDDQPPLKFSIPELGDVPLVEWKSFNWNNQSELSELWLLALWRRLYKPTKRIDQYQIDINKTVEQVCQDGLLLAPAMSDRSYNTAELLLLIDSSEYMAPWQSTSALLTETASSKLSRLKQAHIYYFNKMPGKSLYQDPELNRPIDIDKVFLKTRHAVIIVFSEAGAAANKFEPFRQKRLEQLMQHSSLQAGRKIVWLNPMPSYCWCTSFNILLNRHSRIKACPLSANALLQAIQYLRED